MTTLTVGTHIVTITPQNPVVRFELIANTPLHIYTTGGVDTYCQVLNVSNLSTVATFDDYQGNLNFNFKIPDDLSYGTYYLDVSLYNQQAVNAQFNLVVISATAQIEHVLLSALLPDITQDYIQHTLSSLLTSTDYTDHVLDCPVLAVTYNEHNLACPFYGVAHIDHVLKIADIRAIEHQLIIGQSTTASVTHVLPILMTSNSHVEHQLICPVGTDNQEIHIEHLLIIPMINTQSVVVDVHAPELPLHGSY